MKTLISAVMIATTSLSLAACNSQTEEPVEAAPEGPEGISVENARLMLPPVSGNPAAIYFDVLNDGTTDMVIRAVSVEGADSAVIHKMGTWSGEEVMNDVFQLAVPAGASTKLIPGEMHVMAEGLPDTLKPGDSIEVTLTFAGGDKYSFPTEVRAAGDDRDAPDGDGDASDSQ